MSRAARFFRNGLSFYVTAIGLICTGLSFDNIKPVLIANLLCENSRNPMAVVEKKPLLSWQLQCAERNITQSSYRILVSDDSMLLEKMVGNCWDSKRVFSDQSIQIPYSGTALKAGMLYYWKAKIWDNRNRSSGWSETAHWRTGLSSAADWKGAQWIGYRSLPADLIQVPAVEEDNADTTRSIPDTLPLLRKSFTMAKPVSRVLAYVCGLGQFEFYLNGRKVGDHFLDPAWTKYDKEVQYVTFDVTGDIVPGKNAMGVMFGNGFYNIPRERYRKIRGAFGSPALLFRLAIRYADGSAEDLVSDTSWKTSGGPIIFSSIYGGEDYDARLNAAGWDKADYNDGNWKKAIAVTGTPVLVPQLAGPLKYFDHFTPKRAAHPKADTWVFDLGQNASGIPRISVRGKRGQTIKIIPAELLDSNGLASQQSSGSPVYFRYTLNGDSIEDWQPRFMYYGFRYLQIEGAAPDSSTQKGSLATLLSVGGIHTRNSAAKAGDFSCSDSLFNKIFVLIDWAIRSNMASIFTDCPHREKLGWLEEVNLVGPSIRYNYDIASLLRKVVRDMQLEQTPDGLIPDIAPEFVKFESGFRDSPEWGSSAILLPWYAYQWYGDRRLLEESYPMMTRYADYLEKKSTQHLLNFGLGDWYDIGPNPPGESQLTPAGLTATASWYQDLTILSKVATLLGKPTDSAIFTHRSAKVKSAFNEKFFNDKIKQYGSGSQTANAMACYLNLTEAQDKKAVFDNLVADIRTRNYSLTTGDIGYRYLLQALATAGRSDLIFDMNSRSDVPGYGFQLARGATALTESWQAYPFESNNHFMFGELLEWFYGSIGGIRSADTAAAFHSIVIEPEPVGTLTSANTYYDCPYGRIESRWKKGKNVFSLFVSIPPNTRANLYFPVFEKPVLTESGRAVNERSGFRHLGVVNGRDGWAVGSGAYSFVLKHL